MYSRKQRYFAEFIGTAFLLATVVGSGIMAENLANGNTAIALLGNTIPTGAILFVLISLLGPISGAHFNPAVSLVFVLRNDLGRRDGVGYVLMQVVGAITGTFAAHMMFEMDILQTAQTDRTGSAQWFSEWVATFGLVLVILGMIKVKAEAVAASVGLYITAAYWFTASTSFANPAVTLARSLTDTFSGITPGDVPGFIIMQMLGAWCALLICNRLFAHSEPTSSP